MDTKELKERLTNISSQLQNLTRSQATISKLLECGKVKVVDTTVKEGEDPAALSVNGADAIQEMMNPIIKQLNSQKEKLLNFKEALLNALEQAALPAEPAADSAPVEEKKEE
jgi:hypothetical protein